MKKNISSFPGIYIHVPFCEHKCGYCDFYSLTGSAEREAFVSALLKEMLLSKEEADFEQAFDTVYLGGGTPSLLKTSELDKILSFLFSNFPFAADTEITIEVNPGTVTEQDLAAYKEMGINRLSIGVQSFDDKQLRFLERIHDAGQSGQAEKAARRAGFDNIGLDLISSLPAETLSGWQGNLQKALSYQPEHLSVYNLSYEQGTPFYRRMLKGEIVPKSEGEELRFMKMTLELLKKNGFIPYEISNYAADESRFSRHNYKYWNHSNYLGFGPSAHSFWKNVRSANLRSLSGYLSSLENNRLPIASKEKISSRTLEFEHIFLSLRTYEGLDLQTFIAKFGMPFPRRYRELTAALVKEGLAESTEGVFRFTQKGMFICDEILPQFIKD